MKKFFILLTAILITVSALFLTGCDSPYHPEGSTASSKYTQNASEEYESTSQSSTKYSAATVPTESTTQQSTQQSTEPPSPDIVGGDPEKIITDEDMSALITENI